MTEVAHEGSVLWAPTADRRARSNLALYLEWLAVHAGHRFADYDALWRWSVTEIEAFWESIRAYFDVRVHDPYGRVLADRSMPGARWFEGATLNYAEHALRRRDSHAAIVYRCEDGTKAELSYADLAEQVARAAAGLRRLGVKRGDRVAAFVPNCPEALIAFLATASLGATWSSCSPEFGTAAVLDRFRQIEPRVLIGVDRTSYQGRAHDRSVTLTEIRAALPSVRHVVVVRRSSRPSDDAVSWAELCGQAAELSFAPVPFSHPLWILYSSGTTGLPKAIVQGHGGILLEHLKSLSLHMDLGPEDRFFWFTTTGWMMWNLLVGGLLVGSTVLLYEGSPAHPDLSVLWRFAAEARMTYFGSSAPFLMSCRKAGLSPGSAHDLSSLRGVGSTGAPLPPEGFGWVYEHVGRDLLLGSVSGGTDVCTGFVLSCPLLPVRAGEIQCRALGAKVESFDPAGRPVHDEVGELVLTEPLPSMPVSFWNDPDGRRLRESYFDTYPGVWRHGDWIKIKPGGSCVIYGRSDSTLNRGGVRMGTSEFYRVVEDIPEIADSVVVDTGSLGRDGSLWLFVVLRPGATLDDALGERIRSRLRQAISPRHVPDEIRSVPAVPRTLSGKKLEVPIKRILMGTPPDEAASRDTLADPAALDAFVALGRAGR